MTSTQARQFESNSTASGKCGFTLMNNQVGEVVAEVMRRKDNVTVTSLPAMIRIDADRRLDVDFSEIDEAAGEEDGWFDQAEFEESISTHYGRMIFEDHKAVLFANPEDAAEELGFDLKPIR